LYHPSIPQNKCSTICVGLSLVFIKKEAQAIEKKYGHMEVQEKKEKKIVMLSKEFTERDHTKERSFHFIHHNSYTCTS